MYQIPNSAIRWGSVANRHVPNQLDLVCSACKWPVTFQAQGWEQHTAHGKPLQIRCPREQCHATFNIIRLGGDSYPQARVYIDAVHPSREPVAGLDLVPEEKISSKLKEAYQSALTVYATGQAAATAVMCRRVLEGILKGDILPDEVKTEVLAQRIKALAGQHEKLSKPLVELSELVKEGGNLGAHFDDEFEATIDDAGRMLDLLDYLLAYLFVVPEQIHRFRTEVLKSEKAKKPAESGK